MSTEFRCEVCDGYGVIGRDVDHPCPRCGGSGLKDSVGSGDRAGGYILAKDRAASADRRGDLYLHVRAITTPAPADANRPPHPIDSEPGVGVAQPQGTSLSARHPIVTAAAPLITEEKRFELSERISPCGCPTTHPS